METINKKISSRGPPVQVGMSPSVNTSDSKAGTWDETSIPRRSPGLSWKLVGALIPRWPLIVVNRSTWFARRPSGRDWRLGSVGYTPCTGNSRTWLLAGSFRPPGRRRLNDQRQKPVIQKPCLRNPTFWSPLREKHPKGCTRIHGIDVC